MCKTAFEKSKEEDLKHSNWIDSPWPGESGREGEGEEGGRERVRREGGRG